MSRRSTSTAKSFRAATPIREGGSTIISGGKFLRSSAFCRISKDSISYDKNPLKERQGDYDTTTSAASLSESCHISTLNQEYYDPSTDNADVEYDMMSHIKDVKRGGLTTGQRKRAGNIERQKKLRDREFEKLRVRQKYLQDDREEAKKWRRMKRKGALQKKGKAKAQKELRKTSTMNSVTEPQRRKPGLDQGKSADPNSMNNYRKRLQVTPLKKVAKNMTRLMRLGLRDRVPVVLASVGAFNPPHLMHARMFHVARKYLEYNTDFIVVGGFVVPSHDKYVMLECRGQNTRAIPAKHRVGMAEALFKNSSWVDVDRWECTRECGYLDYPTVLKHLSALIKQTFGSHVHTMYTCGPSHLSRCTPETLSTYGCVCVTRGGYTGELADEIADRWQGLVHIAEDDEVLPHTMAIASSTKVLRAMAAGESPSAMVGKDVENYMLKYDINEKIKRRGKKKWTKSDKNIQSLITGRKKATKQAAKMAMFSLLNKNSALAKQSNLEEEKESGDEDDEEGSGFGFGKNFNLVPKYTLSREEEERIQDRLLRSLTPLTAMHTRPPTVKDIFEGMRGYLQVPTGVVDADKGLYSDMVGASTISVKRGKGDHEPIAENEEVQISNAEMDPAEAGSTQISQLKIVTGMGTVREMKEKKNQGELRF